MELYFLRHGEAEGLLYNTPEADFERELTDQGRQDMLIEAKGLKKFVSHFDLILTSPLERASQTAEIFANVFNSLAVLRKSSALQPPCDVARLMEEIAVAGEVNRVLCVGHAPSLGLLATEMISGLEEENFFHSKKGAVIRLDVDAPTPETEASLIYFIHPDFLKALGGHPGGIPMESMEFASGAPAVSAGLPPEDAFLPPEDEFLPKEEEPVPRQPEELEEPERATPTNQLDPGEVECEEARRRMELREISLREQLEREHRRLREPEKSQDLGSRLRSEVSSLTNALDSLFGKKTNEGRVSESEHREALNAIHSFMDEPDDKHEEPPQQHGGLDIQL